MAGDIPLSLSASYPVLTLPCLGKDLFFELYNQQLSYNAHMNKTDYAFQHNLYDLYITYRRLDSCFKAKWRLSAVQLRKTYRKAIFFVNIRLLKWRLQPKK